MTYFFQHVIESTEQMAFPLFKPFLKHYLFYCYYNWYLFLDSLHTRRVYLLCILSTAPCWILLIFSSFSGEFSWVFLAYNFADSLLNLIFFCGVITLAYTCKLVWNRSGAGRHLCSISDVNGHAALNSTCHCYINFRLEIFVYFNLHAIANYFLAPEFSSH